MLVTKLSTSFQQICQGRLFSGSPYMTLFNFGAIRCASGNVILILQYNRYTGFHAYFAKYLGNTLSNLMEILFYPIIFTSICHLKGLLPDLDFDFEPFRRMHWAQQKVNFYKGETKD